MTFHLHTETRPNIGSIVGRYFDDFTMTRGTGFWHGGTEPTTIIEIVTDNHDRVLDLAADLKTQNDQQAVLVECSDTTSTLV